MTDDAPFPGEVETYAEHLARTNVHFVRVDADGVVNQTRGNTDRAAFELMRAADPGYTEVADSAGVEMGDWRDPKSGEIRKPLSMVLAVRGAAVTGLPRPCTVALLGEAHEVADGRVDLDADQPGTYRLTVTAPRYYPYEVEVVVP